MREREEETRFAWPSDGSAFNLTRDVLEKIPMPEIVDCIIPELTGKAALCCWMVASGADATAVRRTLNIGVETLRAYCGSTLEVVQQHTGDTIIVRSGDKL